MVIGPEMPRPRVTKPYTIATKMSSIEIIAVCWLARLVFEEADAVTTDVLATMDANATAAKTNVHAKMQKNSWPRRRCFPR